MLKRLSKGEARSETRAILALVAIIALIGLFVAWKYFAD